jgi:PPOX class probable F420-dependent enzyme
MLLDLSQPKNAHIDRRLRAEPIIWLSSVRPNGRPHLVPVWFLWDGESILIFSKPNNQKLRNIQENPNVMLALEAANQGNDIVLIEGVAEFVEDPEVSPAMPEYAEKYAGLLGRMNWTAEKMATSYTQAVRVRPGRVFCY